MAALRILIQSRRTQGEQSGGDARLVGRLTEELRGLGHEVTTAPAPPSGGVEGFDVVQAFNLDRSVLAETEAFALAAARARRPLFVTPFWWPPERYLGHLTRADRWRYRLLGTPALRALRDRRLSSLRSIRGRQARVLAAAKGVLVSGESEGRWLRQRFGPLPVVVVHSAGTEVRPGPSPSPGPREGVLCVARLDPRKNQLHLIRALSGTGLRLRLVGTAGIFPGYAGACRDAAGPDVEFAGFLTDQELDAAYRSCRVHALPSLFELPGLTSLDAAAAGAAVVAGREGTAEDFFGADARYCDPDPDSIRAAVLSAYEAGPPTGLDERVASQWAWRAAAERYLVAYSDV